MKFSYRILSIENTQKWPDREGWGRGGLVGAKPSLGQGSRESMGMDSPPANEYTMNL